MSLTSPLGLMRHVRRPDLRLEIVPWLNVLVVAWLLTLLQNSYIIAPGLTIPLGPEKFQLPTAPPADKSNPSSPGRLVDVTLSVQASQAKIENKIFYLKNGSYHFVDLPKALATAATNLRKPPGERPMLLLLEPADMDVESQEKLCELARVAGFDVQLGEHLAPNSPDQSAAAETTTVTTAP